LQVKPARIIRPSPTNFAGEPGFRANHHLRSDAAAVQAALTERWSNGQVEGQVGRLKAIKRSMYGRAGMKLLRARVRHKG
jgi:transposase